MKSIELKWNNCVSLNVLISGFVLNSSIANVHNIHTQVELFDGKRRFQIYQIRNLEGIEFARTKKSLKKETNSCELQHSKTTTDQDFKFDSFHSQ